MRTTRLALGATLLFLCLLAGCKHLQFKAMSTPPPGRTASLDDASKTITLAKDIALAIDCSGWDNTGSGPCRGVAAAVDDPAIVEVMSPDVDYLVARTASSGGGFGSSTSTQDTQKPSILVVVGKAAGSTTLRFTTSYGPATFSVSVLAPE